MKKSLFDNSKIWFVFFILVFALFYAKVIHPKRCEAVRLREKMALLEEEKDAALVKEKELKEQIAAEQDPEWVERVLMRKLGLAPEGQKRVFFKREKERDE